MNIGNILCAICLVAVTAAVSHMYYSYDPVGDAVRTNIREQELEDRLVKVVDEYFNKIYNRVDNYSTDLTTYKYQTDKKIEALETRIKRLENIAEKENGGLVINNQNTLSGLSK